MDVRDDGGRRDDAEVCLTPMDVRDDGARDDVHVCLSDTPPEVGSDDGLPICPPDYCDICLNAPIDWCILECPAPDAGGAAAAEPRSAAQQRLASAGVLSAEQLGRLRKLQGRGG